MEKINLKKTSRIDLRIISVAKEHATTRAAMAVAFIPSMEVLLNDFF